MHSMVVASPEAAAEAGLDINALHLIPKEFCLSRSLARSRKGRRLGFMLWFQCGQKVSRRVDQCKIY
uniref:Uncharacterized protein n=1 Tax=Brassica campestris TaxID=3711 RepID=A0A3P6AC50_BRACM|nr:unnamed protein product [Brassica rapa]